MRVPLLLLMLVVAKEDFRAWWRVGGGFQCGVGLGQDAFGPLPCTKHCTYNVASHTRAGHVNQRPWQRACIHEVMECHACVDGMRTMHQHQDW